MSREKYYVFDTAAQWQGVKNQLGLNDRVPVGIHIIELGQFVNVPVYHVNIAWDNVEPFKSLTQYEIWPDNAQVRTAGLSVSNDSWLTESGVPLLDDDGMALMED